MKLHVPATEIGTSCRYFHLFRIALKGLHFLKSMHSDHYISIMANISECSTATNKRTVCAKNVSIEAGLAALEDRQSRRRCRQAYKFLMKSCASSYKLFIHKHQNALETNDKINLYDYTDIEGIECCLWPNLYPYTSWCETTLKR